MSEGHNVQEQINYAGFVYVLLTPKTPKIEHCISFTHRRRIFPVSLFIWLSNQHQGCDFDERPIVNNGPSQSPWSLSIHYINCQTLSIRSPNVFFCTDTYFLDTGHVVNDYCSMHILSSDIIGEIILIQWCRGFIYNIFQCLSFVCFEKRPTQIRDIATWTIDSSYSNKVSRSTFLILDTTNNLPKWSQSDSADTKGCLFLASFLAPISLKVWSFFSFQRRHQFNGIRTNSCINKLY